MNKKKVQVLARLNVWLEQALLGEVLRTLPMRVLYINAANFLNEFFSFFIFLKKVAKADFSRWKQLFSFNYAWTAQRLKVNRFAYSFAQVRSFI